MLIIDAIYKPERNLILKRLRAGAQASLRSTVPAHHAYKLNFDHPNRSFFGELPRNL